MMKQTVMKQKTSRGWGKLLFWNLFIGIGAIVGSVGMWIDPSGKEMGLAEQLTYFQVLPFANYLFQDFVVPGVALMLVNGLPNLFVAWLAWRKRPIAAPLNACLGVILMLWVSLQFYLLPLNPVSTLYLFFGFTQALTGWRLSHYPN